jgi:hypothetical protein
VPLVPPKIERGALVIEVLIPVLPMSHRRGPTESKKLASCQPRLVPTGTADDEALGRHVRHHAMQEQCCLIEQPMLLQALGSLGVRPERTPPFGGCWPT